MSDRHPNAGNEARALAVAPAANNIALAAVPRVVEEERQNLWSLLDDRLRGRWRLAIAAGLVLGVVGAAAGYFLTTPQYQSSGLIRVAPNISPVLQDIPETGILPLYESFVATQVSLITSRPVLERALRDEDLAALASPEEPWSIPWLVDGLTVGTSRRTELITVQFSAERADVAQAAVIAVLAAYDELHASRGGDETGRTLATLRSRQTELRQERNAKHEEIKKIVAATEYGMSDFDMMIDSRVGRLESIEAAIASAEEALAAQPTEAADGAGAAGPAAWERPGPTTRELDEFDPQLARLRGLLEDARYQLDVARNTYRPGSRAYAQAEETARLAQELVEKREDTARATLLAAAGGAAFASPAEELERLRPLAETTREEIRALNVAEFRVAELEREVEDLEHDLGQITDRIDSLNLERESIRTGRIAVIATGDRPSVPSSDRRRKLAAVGLVGGFGLGFGALFLLGTIDRRAYGSSQLQGARGARCLGVLPDLGRRRADEEGQLVAAHCVHQIRNQLEAVRRPTEQFVLCVSSPYQGDGKTSLVAALGWSYAAAGDRTVLVDCDFVGQSLTEQMDMAGRAGVREALKEGHSNGNILWRRGDNLEVVPAGADVGVGAAQVRRRDLEALFARLRRDHDVIIVDTGPLPGSLESLPAAAAADGVLLVMRRGGRRPRMDECTEHLERVGANVLGSVLNCAVVSDCIRYVGQSSYENAMRVDEAAAATGGDVPSNILLHAMSASTMQGDEDDAAREDGGNSTKEPGGRSS